MLFSLKRLFALSEGPPQSADAMFARTIAGASVAPEAPAYEADAAMCSAGREWCAAAAWVAAPLASDERRPCV